MAVFDVVLPRRPGQFRVGWVSLDEYSGGRNQRHFAFGKRLGHWRSGCLGGIGVLLAESPLFPFRIRVEMKCVYLRHRYECALRMMDISFEFEIVSLSYPGHHPRGGAFNFVEFHREGEHLKLGFIKRFKVDDVLNQRHASAERCPVAGGVSF